MNWIAIIIEKLESYIIEKYRENFKPLSRYKVHDSQCKMAAKQGNWEKALDKLLNTLKDHWYSENTYWIFFQDHISKTLKRAIDTE